MKQRLILLFSLLTAMIFLPGGSEILAQTATEIPVCSTCQKACNRGYVRVRGETFCSETCLAKKYFCALCGKTLGNRECPAFSTGTDIEENPIFFCPDCMKKPGCTFCISRKNVSELRDGRLICETCKKTAIFRTEDAIPILESAQKILQERFDFPIKADIPLTVLNKEEFWRRAEGTQISSNTLALHLTHFEGKTHLSDDGKILTIEMDEFDSGMIVLEGSPAALAFDSIVHELTHEFLRRKFYHFEDAKIEEGFCESIAAACSIYNGHPHLAERRITNPDPIYGDGFRLVYTLLQEKGWDETMKFLQENSQSMRDYIRTHITEILDAETLEHIRENNLKPKLKFGKIK